MRAELFVVIRLDFGFDIAVELAIDADLAARLSFSEDADRAVRQLHEPLDFGDRADVEEVSFFRVLDFSIALRHEEDFVVGHHGLFERGN